MLLFVCVRNAGRSVMAEAFARSLGLEARSAGTMPADTPHPEVVAVMAEVGIDVSGHSGTLLTDELVRSARRVFTMGCGDASDACPAIRYANLEDWALDDPAGRDPQAVREIRDEIERRVRALAATAAG